MPNHRLSVLLSKDWFAPGGGAAHLSSFTSTSLFLHYFNEKMSNDTDQFYFETPVAFKKLADADIVAHVRHVARRSARSLTDAQCAHILKCFASARLAADDTEPTPNYLYISCLLSEVTRASRLNVNVRRFLAEERMPRNLESFLKYKLGKCSSFIIINPILNKLFNKERVINEN